MKKLVKVLSVSICATLVAGVAWAAAPEFKNEQEKLSYALGVNVAKKLKQQGVSVDVTLLKQGVSDEMGGKSRLTEAEVSAILQKLQNETREKKEAEMKKVAAANKERGIAFLAENAKKEGVKTLRWGIQYRVLQAGSGEIPSDEDTVLCNYRGMLVDGTVFDASPPDKPVAIEVSQVIRSWRVALKQMPVGSKWELVIPAEAAYGESGAPPGIGPNETLIFELELVGIEE